MWSRLAQRIASMWKVGSRRVRGMCSFLLPVNVNSQDSNTDMIGPPSRCSICHVQSNRGVSDGHHVILLAGTQMFVLMFIGHPLRETWHLHLHPPTGALSHGGLVSARGRNILAFRQHGIIAG